MGTGHKQGQVSAPFRRQRGQLGSKLGLRTYLALMFKVPRKPDRDHRNPKIQGRAINGPEHLQQYCPSNIVYFCGSMNVLPDGPMPVICMITSPSFAQLKCVALGGSE
jgi:hypothetical protein